MWEIETELEADIKQLKESLARAVEEERMANYKAVCAYCADQVNYQSAQLEGYLWAHRLNSKIDTSYRICAAAAIHERSQVKGEWL